jgi:hypothetical protein
VNVSCMSRVVTTYCTSCWIPAVVHVVSFIAAYLAIIFLCLYKLSKSMPGEITWPVTIVLIIWAVISWFIMPLSVIINLCKKRWLKSVIAIFLGSVATLPVVLFVLYVRVLSGWH